jgi:hypothetical protein
MIIELESYVKRQAMRFTVKLDKRFEKYVSDQFIVAYLVSSFMDEVYQSKHGRRMNIAYKAAVGLFEKLLEHGCKAGGNGHHLAQAFASMFDANEAYENIPET